MIQQGIEEKIKELQKHHSDPNSQEMKESVKDFLTSDLIKNRLEELLTNDELAMSLLKLSYIHLNGFKKLVIFSNSDDTFHIRLHQWLEKEKFDQNIHNHRFNFWSLVLKGSLINHIYEPSNSGSQYIHYKYMPRNGKDTYEMQRIREESLKENNSFKVEANNLYFFEGTWLHTTEYEGNPITLLLEDRRALLPYADVYTKVGKEYKDIVKYSAPAMTLEEYRKNIDTILVDLL